MKTQIKGQCYVIEDVCKDGHCDNCKRLLEPDKEVRS